MSETCTTCTLLAALVGAQLPPSGHMPGCEHATELVPPLEWPTPEPRASGSDAPKGKE